MNSITAAPEGARAEARPRGRVTGRRRRFNRYTLLLGAVTAAVALATIGLNSLVDPLWFGKGNRLTGENYIFNERIAKLNLLLQDPEAYDCLIFGSSRVTLLDHTQVKGYRCFNLSFSAGKIADFLAYARYLADRGLRPELVIVGIDDFNFLRHAEDPMQVPDFVLHGEPPPGLLRSYLSLSVLDFTQRTLRGASPYERYYDDRFIGRVLPGTLPYQPPAALEDIDIHTPYDPRRAALYAALRDSFPDARFWGFVPPVSPWKVAEWRYLGGVLELYLEAMTRTAAAFDRFYDFSAPGPVTADPANTYDGSHYRPEVYAVVVERLQGGQPAPPADGFGLPVHAMSPAHYRRSFQGALRRFLVREFPRLAQLRRRSR